MANFVVTNSNNAGAGSLRDAVAQANANADADTITFAAGLAGSTITLTGGELVLINDVTIDGDVNGDNKADITISGNNASRIFRVSGLQTDVDLLSLTLTNGNVTAGSNFGGVVHAAAISSLDITDTTISNSAAFNGGAIYLGNYSTATLTNSLVTGNSAGSHGGGIFVDRSAVTLTNTTIHANQANNNGGGIAVGPNTSSLSLLNSTVTGNRANADGLVPGSGGGIDSFNANVNVSNSVVADNLVGTGTTENDVNGTVNSASFSVFGTDITITNNISSQENVADVGLGALANHGGTVATRNINEGSVLINAGENASAAGLVTDANGNDRQVAGTVDVGATEFQLVVTTAADVVNANDGVLSLREAVALANANAIAFADADTITFAAGLAGSTITLTGGQLMLTNELTIDGDVNGDNKADITISGNNASRIFNIENSPAFDVAVSLLSLNLTNGNAGVFGRGGAIRAVSALQRDTLIIRDTAITDSSAFVGGGIYAPDTFIVLTNSLLEGNTASDRGGGIFSSFDVRLTNSTVHGNSSNVFGGGIYATGFLTLTSSTVTGNRADANGDGFGYGGGIFNGGAYIRTDNSVVADNLTGTGATEDDFRGSVTTAINSVFGTAVTIVNSFSNLTNVTDVGLGQMLDNGGTVLTRSPLDGSVLIGAGSNAELPSDGFDLDGDGDTGEVLPLDGRRGLRIVGSTVDVGAVEQIVNETIGGTEGDDTIVGGLGNDTLDGRGGRDTIDWSGATGALVVTLSATGGGTVTAAGIDTDTFSNFENMRGGSAGDTLVGNAGVNELTGNGGADIILGGLGNDTLNGDDGLDRLYGGDNDDTLNGGAGDDIMEGGAGNDTVGGGTGNDNMRGNGGNDIFLVDSNTDVVVELTGEGMDEVRSTAAITGLSANVENLIGLSNTGQNLSGNGEANVITAGGGNDIIYGNGGNDRIDGGAGTDNMRGNDGDDIYFVDAFDFVTELAGQGTDEVRSTAARTGLSADVENLTGLANTGQNLSGNGAANVITAADGADIIYGLAGNDTIFGGGGADNIRGGDNNDRIDGGLGSDILFGGASAGSGAGSGNDTFVEHGAAGYDGIYDFQGGAGAGDLVELKTIASGGLYASSAAAFAALRQIGSNVFLAVDADSGVWFVNRTIAQMNADDFGLVA